MRIGVGEAMVSCHGISLILASAYSSFFIQGIHDVEVPVNALSPYFGQVFWYTLDFTTIDGH
jgi:hypothetical protein